MHEAPTANKTVERMAGPPRRLRIRDVLEGQPSLTFALDEMRMNRAIITIIVASLILVSPLCARAGDPFAGARGNVKLGATLEQCRSAITYRELRSTETTELLNRHPWVETHCYLLAPLKAGRVVVWTDDKATYLGWPMYVFGTFSEDGRMVDLVGSHFGYTDPLVPGTYATRVASLKKGMNVTEMYELVGRQNPTYRKKDGKWIVEFSYNGYLGQFYHVEADAATGVITLAGNWTI